MYWSVYVCFVFFYIFFFFQAEDGIRDRNVTGVQTCALPICVHVELPEGTAGFLKSKSGLNTKHGITSEGVIDVGYTGSIVAKLYNHSGIDYKVNAGDKITQLVSVPILTPELELVESLGETERGNKGFGSTGK